jgi:hypothetical protein
MNEKLTLDRALECIQKGIAKAHELGFRLGVNAPHVPSIRSDLRAY